MFGSSYSLNSASMESLPTSPQLTPAFVVAEQLTLTVTKYAVFCTPSRY